MSEELVLGIDIGGTFTKLGLVDKSGTILMEDEVRSTEHETIEKIPGELCVKMKVTERHKKFVDTAMKLFQDTIDDPSSIF